MTPARPRIAVAWQTARRGIPDRAVRAAVAAALAHGGRTGLAIGAVLVDDATLAGLHGRFLGDPSPTDVIAFDLDDGLGGVAAEVYVSVECAERVARERGVAVADEVALYLVHGALHLCGYDDRTPAQRTRMRAAEARVIETLAPARRARGRAPRR